MTSSALQSRKWQLIGMSQWAATRLVSHFPPHLKCVTTLPYEIQKINNSNSLDVFHSITIIWELLNRIKCSKRPPLTRTNAQRCLCHSSIASSMTLCPNSEAVPDLRQALLQFIDVMKLISVANVSVHASRPKEDILTYNVTQEYTNN